MSLKLVLLRHGESEWNLANRFTGWTDVGLSEKGIKEAHTAGIRLKADGYTFDMAFTSVLKRAISTLWIVQEEMDLMWIPVERNWRLNERHYGALQGLNKAQTAEKYGSRQVHIWRRSFDVPPPELAQDDERHSRFDPRYRNLSKSELPATECLKDTMERVMPYWNSHLLPLLRQGKKLLIAAHGNSLRALVKHLDNISDEDIPGCNIPTGIPLVYEFDEGLNVLKHTYLADEEEVKAAAEAVARQAEKK